MAELTGHVTVEMITAPDQEPVPAPDPDEARRLRDLAALGVDVRVWR